MLVALYREQSKPDRVKCYVKKQGKLWSETLISHVFYSGTSNQYERVGVAGASSGSVVQGDEIPRRDALARDGRKLPVRFEIQQDGDVAASLDYVDFEMVRCGTEEMTFSNEQQQTPWKVTFTVNFKKKKFTFKLKLGGVLNVNQAQQGIKFQQAMHEGGLFCMIDIKTGLTVYSNPLVKNKHPQAFDPWPEVLEDLVFIQNKAEVVINLRALSIDADEARRIKFIAQILKTGRATFNSHSYQVVFTCEQLVKALTFFENNGYVPVAIHFKDGQVAKIFNAEIPLGPAIMVCDRMYFDGSDLMTLKERVANGDAEDLIETRFTLGDSDTVEAKYLNWLPREEAAREEEMLASINEEHRMVGGTVQNSQP